MSGHKPILIITDQDQVMINAVAEVFEESSHRFCMWHILKKLSEKVGGSLNENRRGKQKGTASLFKTSILRN
jgi:hypothetical protein